jgi:Bacterial Ig-like domain (group 2)
MNRKWLGKWCGIFGLVAAGVLLFNVSSCARSQQLVSVAIQPGTETFGASNIPVNLDAGLSVQLRALGTYIHPPVTKDITDQVTWDSNTPAMVTVDSTGLITATGLSCGGTLISATVQTNSDTDNRSSSGAIITGYMSANVVCFTGTGGNSGPALTVTFPGTGSGTITSSPLGLSCASNPTGCTANFPSGTTITLTAMTSGTFAGWGGCDMVSGSGLVCTVDNLTGDRSITATFD